MIQLDRDPDNTGVVTVGIAHDAIDLALKKAGLTRADVGNGPPEIIVPDSGVLHLRFEGAPVYDTTNGQFVYDTWTYDDLALPVLEAVIIPFIFDLPAEEDDCTTGDAPRYAETEGSLNGR